MIDVFGASSSKYLVSKASGLDVLAILPGRIGFIPHDSIVVGGLHPPRGGLGVVMRVDRLRADAAAVKEFALDRIGFLHGSGARASFLVRYAPAGSVAAEADEFFWVWAEALAGQLPVVGCWDVMGESCQEFDPARRRPIGPVFGAADLQSTRGAATLAVAGLAPKACRADLARIEPASAAARKAARAAEQRALDQTLALGPEQMRKWRLAGLENWVGCLNQLLLRPATAPPASQLGRLAALLTDRISRDAVMASVFVDCDDLPRRIAGGGDAGTVFDPWTSAGIDHERAEVALELLEWIGSHLTPRRRGTVYALGAAWHWWSGNGAAAEEWARAGLDCNDCPQLASLILAVTARGIFPAALQGQFA
ncbi:MAG: DUF4192 domain-containing protein [Bifidobacteriaceae bacterium]|nr:DUF4192 domain-containing protein [Bifidobacteriaceae bacterium]